MVKITTRSNGVLFETTGIPNSGITFAKFMFKPKNYPSIEKISMFNDKIIGTSLSGEDFNLTLNGSNQSYPISVVNGSTVTSIEDLFFKFIDSLS